MKRVQGRRVVRRIWSFPVISTSHLPMYAEYRKAESSRDEN